MNISISHSWLKEFLTTNASPEKIAECLSLCGPSVEELEKTKDDYLYHMEVTTNRVDMMGVLGIAREAAAILPQFGIKARLKNDLYPPARPIPAGKPFPLKVAVDQQLCPRFSAVVISNVTVKSAPQKISNYLEKSGIRSLNNVVDISNYLMRAYGQPVHTFDLDKIQAKMVLRLSKKGETITTLDGKRFTLPGNDIVIADAGNRLIDLCGIMGGLNSAVDNNTKNVLLFVQIYSPKHIRATSMTLGQRSEAAQIFEKQPDPELVMPVILKGIQLFKQLTGREQGSQIIDLYPQPPKSKNVFVPLQLIKDRLGVEVSIKKVNSILQSLGFKGFPQVTVPSWRANDVTIAEDIVEEVARIYGYHHLPGLIMATTIPTNYPATNLYLEQQIKHWLVGMDLTEIYTNSMISQKLAEASGYPLSAHLKIKNALSEDWQYLRRSLIPSHTQAFPAFEIANTYHPRPGHLPEEKLQLIISGFTDHLKLKGIVESLFRKLHISATFTPTEILVGKTQLGTIGRVASNVHIADLSVSALTNQSSLYPHYQALPTTAPIIEDMTFTLPPQTYLGPIMDTIKSVSPLIESVTLKDRYENNFTFTITYRNPKSQLTDHDVAPLRAKITSKLALG